MKPDCTIQLHTDGDWRDVGSVTLFGAERDGWRAKTYAGYTVEWAFEHAGARDARALCAQCPVTLEPLELPHWPGFLIDMLPQGLGRQELLQRIGLASTADLSTDWPLLLVGAGNPGRVTTAARQTGAACSTWYANSATKCTANPFNATAYRCNATHCAMACNR